MLTFLWILPALGALVALASGRSARWTALAVSLAALGLSLRLAAMGGLVAEMGVEGIFGLRYSLALDGLSLSLVGLTTGLTVIALLASWEQELSPGYWSCFLFLEAALLGVFLARDLFLFYVFWEATLIPMFFIIGIWGSEQRRHAAMKFFLFTFGGSLFMLIGILVLVTKNHAALGAWTWDMATLRGDSAVLAPQTAVLVFCFIALGLGVKIPVVPLHTWLPDAHTEAPAAGSIMLAGVMLKMGIYGFLRVLMPIFPELSWALVPFLGLLAATNIIYGSLCAMAQSDLKRLVAYSSVAHLGFCLLGVLSRTPEGLAGGSLQMINHGLTTGALFLMVGFLYERTHRRGVGDFGGLVERAPWLTFFFGFSVMASIGLPGLNGFVGEFMSLAGMTRTLPALAVAGVAGIVFSAAYSLPAYQEVFWGEPQARSVSGKVDDLDAREKALAWSLSLAMLAIGLYPVPVLRLFEAPLKGLVP